MDILRFNVTLFVHVSKILLPRTSKGNYTAQQSFTTHLLFSPQYVLKYILSEEKL